MQNINDLRQALFDTINRLQDEVNPIDLEKAKTIGSIAKILVEAAKAETNHIKVIDSIHVNGAEGTQFIPTKTKKIEAKQ